MQNTEVQENLCWVNCLSCCQSLNRTLSIHVLSQGNKVLEGSDGEDLACSLREPLPVPREEEEEELRSSQGKVMLEELAPGKYSDGQEQWLAEDHKAKARERLGVSYDFQGGYRPLESAKSCGNAVVVSNAGQQSLLLPK